MTGLVWTTELFFLELLWAPWRRNPGCLWVSLAVWPTDGCISDRKSARWEMCLSPSQELLGCSQLRISRQCWAFVPGWDVWAPWQLQHCWARCWNPGLVHALMSWCSLALPLLPSPTFNACTGETAQLLADPLGGGSLSCCGHLGVGLSVWARGSVSTS